MGDSQKPAGKQKLTSAEKNARAQARKAEWQARLREKEATWKAQVAAHFGYLEDVYGFRVTQVDGSSPWEMFVCYESPLLAVKVTRSVEFEEVEVWLIRLVGGQIPEYPVFITPDTTISYVMLDRIVAERSPKEAENFRALRGLSDEQVERALAFLAASLRAHCDDVLRGDFAIFDVIANQLHEQVRKHPQGITLWSPANALPKEIQALVEKLQKTNPQQPITVERYSTETRSKRRKARKMESPAPVDGESPKPS